MAVNEISVSKIYIKSGEPGVAVSNRFWFDLDSNTLKRYDDTTSSWKPITISPNDIAILNNGETTSLSEYLNTIVEGLFDIDTRVDTVSSDLKTFKESSIQTFVTTDDINQTIRGNKTFVDKILTNTGITVEGGTNYPLTVNDSTNAKLSFNACTDSFGILFDGEDIWSNLVNNVSSNTALVSTLSTKLNNTQPLLSSYSEQMNINEDGCNYVAISAYGNAEEGAQIDINATNINHYTSDININAVDEVGKSNINVNGAFGITITTNTLDEFAGNDQNISINSADNINLSANHNIRINSTDQIQISGNTHILGDTKISNGNITLESESSSNHIDIHNSGISVTTNIAGDSYFLYNGKEVATVDKLPSVYRETISVKEDEYFDFSGNTIVNITPTTYNSTINIGHVEGDGGGGGAHRVNINAYSHVEGDTTITLSAFNTYNTAEIKINTTTDHYKNAILLNNNGINISTDGYTKNKLLLDNEDGIIMESVSGIKISSNDVALEGNVSIKDTILLPVYNEDGTQTDETKELRITKTVDGQYTIQLM